MKTITNYLLIFILAATAITGCKKYEEGPDFSILPAKQRLCNTWKVAFYYEDGVDKTSSFNTLFQNTVFTIEKDGDYTLTYKALGLVDYAETGTWRFTNNKKDFETNPTSGNGSLTTHHILKLTEDAVWYYDMENGVKKEYHLVP